MYTCKGMVTGFGGVKSVVEGCPGIKASVWKWL